MRGFIKKFLRGITILMSASSPVISYSNINYDSYSNSSYDLNKYLVSTNNVIVDYGFLGLNDSNSLYAYYDVNLFNLVNGGYNTIDNPFTFINLYDGDNIYNFYEDGFLTLRVSADIYGPNDIDINYITIDYFNKYVDNSSYAIVKSTIFSIISPGEDFLSTYFEYSDYQSSSYYVNNFNLNHNYNLCFDYNLYDYFGISQGNGSTYITRIYFPLTSLNSIYSDVLNSISFGSNTIVNFSANSYMLRYGIGINSQIDPFNNGAVHDYYYNEGYNVGYQQGVADGSTLGVNIPQQWYAVVLDIIGAPVNIVSESLNFEFLGINVSNLVFGFFTISLLLFIIKLFI